MNQIEKEQKLTEIRRIVADYATAKANRIYLGEYRKSLRSMLMKKYETEGAKTAAQQERNAMADPEYLELLEGLREAVETEEKLRYELVLHEQEFDAWKSRLYAKTAEMKAYGG